jgi:hypothetical protein
MVESTNKPTGCFPQTCGALDGRSSETGSPTYAGHVADAVNIMRSYLTCELTTLFRDGMPQTWPVTAVLLDDVRLVLSTSIAFPQKAINIRRNSKVSLLFSEPTGSGLKTSGAVLVCGEAIAEETVLGDVMARPELAILMQTVFERQPQSKFLASFVGRRVFSPYYLRLLIFVTPVKVWYWPTRDFSRGPQFLDLREVRDVASGRQGA